ncbi:asparagine synthase C-terminal domain-containing protein [Methanogenium sp. MK-MG]|uniref:asparagine synthase C-terminal domain-containing protein n=1 Tax=Methanogenium sp. MK-MG TaxID=2599926 RepID=UPI0013EB593F|nr:asparagine synthase C-terminal domain-containing protein [Methanogenium sp. MK-MG]KAF1078267.1 hypothetical protein MKMG_00840 [Methanogenium sp. MK-MG]
MAAEISLKGWIETGGTVLTTEEIACRLSQGTEWLTSCGGEFFLAWEDGCARDQMGIVPGRCDAGVIMEKTLVTGHVRPEPPLLPLADAIETAVRLRNSEGIVAFSGGVDSALIAAIAGLPCVTVGTEGSHDLCHAAEVAVELGLDLICVTVTPDDVENALRAVMKVIPRVTPVDASIAATLYFVVRWAGENGYSRILAGQGADELFGGYSRYLDAADIERLFREDFAGLAMQSARDQAVANLFGCLFSCPFLDVRVVRAAEAIPAHKKVFRGVRKHPLRKVACRYMPRETACYDKKAMQYGSGIWKVIQRAARKNGYKNSVQEYMNQL